MENSLDVHIFDYIVFRVNPGLTSCKDLAMVVDIIWTKIGACKARYVLPYRYVLGIINLCFYCSHAYSHIAILIQSIIIIKSKSTIKNFELKKE